MRMKEAAEHGPQHKEVSEEIAFGKHVAESLPQGTRVDRWKKGRKVRCVVLEAGVVVPEYLALELDDHYKKLPEVNAKNDLTLYREWEGERDRLLALMEKNNFRK